MVFCESANQNHQLPVLILITALTYKTKSKLLIFPIIFHFVLQTRQIGIIISIRKQRRDLQQPMDEIKNGELEGALFSVYTTREAEKIWGLAENTVNKWCNRGKFYENEARKSGKVWLVTRNGMNRLTRK